MVSKVPPSSLFTMAGGLLVGLLSADIALAQDIQRRFEAWDANNDGYVDRAELPETLRRNFSRVDSDSDGRISLEEHKKFLSRSQTTDRERTRVPAHLLVQRDLAYVPSGHTRQKLDFYRSKRYAGKKLPLVIWIHGGGWRAGNRFPCPALFLADHGFAVASVGYRLSSDAIFPAQLEDCRTAVRYLKNNAEHLGIDPTKMGVWGSSAGGHLVALLGTTGNSTEMRAEDDDFDYTVQAVCDYYGPTDLLKMARQSGPDSRIDHDAAGSPESLLVGGLLQEHAQLAQSANPIGYVDESDPPFLIVHGDSDPLVPVQQSQMLYDSLTQARVSADLVVVPGGGHGPFRGAEQLERVKTFFVQHLNRGSGSVDSTASEQPERK